MTDSILSRLQEDAAAVLSNVPSLAGAHVLVMDAGLTEAALVKALATATVTEGKHGLALIIQQPEIADSDKNLISTLRAEIGIQVIEQVTLNRGTNGTLIRSAAAALRVLSALRLRSLGDVLLYSDKDPVAPLPAKPGYQSYLVTLHCRLDGIPVPAQCADVEASLASAYATHTIGTGEAAIAYGLAPGVTYATIEHKAATVKATTDVAVVGSAVQVTPGTCARIVINGTLSEADDSPLGTPLEMLYAGTYLGLPYFTLDGAPLGNPAAQTEISCVPFAGYWSLVVAPGIHKSRTVTGAPTLANLAGAFSNVVTGKGIPAVSLQPSSAAQVLTALDGSTAAEAIITFSLAADNFSGGDAVPTHAATPLMSDMALVLTTTTAAASIHYTTDGTYPAPGNTTATLYTLPVSGLAPATVVRAAAYKSTLNPGNVLELTITA